MVSANPGAVQLAQSGWFEKGSRSPLVPGFTPPYAIGVNLDIFLLKDDTLDDPDLLPPPDEIVENLEAGLDRFGKVARSLWRP
jgi:hypothetical protein